MAGTNNTPFSPNMDIVAQITGTGAPIPQSTTVTYVASGNTDPTSVFAVSSFGTITTATGNTTVLMPTATFRAGTIKSLQITNDASNPRTLTFTTGFRTSGAITGTNSKSILVMFISDGTTLNEVARSSAVV